MYIWCESYYFLLYIFLDNEYAKDELLALRPDGRNAICLAMPGHSGKHPNEIGSNASNLISVPIRPSNVTAVLNVSIGLQVSLFRLKSYDDCAFSVPAPPLWNRLPADIRHT